MATPIELQMSLLLFVALAGYLIAARINQSAVIGVILAGLLIGPSGLGLVTHSEFVGSIAHLGAIILLFAIGLEFRLNDIVKFRYLVIASVGVVLPFIGGYLIADFFDHTFASSIFIGAALTATSIAITASVLKEMGKLQTDAAKAIIGAAVIDDVLALLVLSFSEQLVAGAISYSSLLVITLKAIGFVGFGAFLGYKYISRIIEKIDKTKIVLKYPEFTFIFAMMFAFLYATIASVVGLSGIVGAFLAGVSLSGVKTTHGKDYREGAEYLHIIFASVFFVSLGILANLRELSFTFGTVGFFLMLLVVAVITKVIGCGLPAKLQGMSRRDSLVVGFGMSPRGEVGMIIALIGLNLGIFGQDIYVSLILIALLTTVLTPIILRNWLYKSNN